MIRGADTQFKFTLPYKCSDVTFAKMVFWQPENDGPSKDRPLPIVKMLEQCAISDASNQLSVILDREETLRFSDKRRAYVQLRIITKDEISVVGKIHPITVYPTYDDHLINDDIVPTPTGYIYLDGDEITAMEDELVSE